VNKREKLPHIAISFSSFKHVQNRRIPEPQFSTLTTWRHKSGKHVGGIALRHGFAFVALRLGLLLLPNPTPPFKQITPHFVYVACPIYSLIPYITHQQNGPSNAFSLPSYLNFANTDRPGKPIVKGNENVARSHWPDASVIYGRLT
jgi:hypothetical protein